MTQRTAHVDKLLNDGDFFKELKDSIGKLYHIKKNSRLDHFIKNLKDSFNNKELEKVKHINLINYLDPVLILKKQSLLLTNKYKKKVYRIKFIETLGNSIFSSIIFTRINNCFFIQEVANSLTSACCLKACKVTNGQLYIAGKVMFQVSITSKCILNISYQSVAKQTIPFEDRVAYGHSADGVFQLNQDKSNIEIKLGTMVRRGNHWEAKAYEVESPQIIRLLHTKFTRFQKTKSDPLMLKDHDLIRIGKEFLEVKII